MIGNLSNTKNDLISTADSDLSFEQYIAECRKKIETKRIREDLANPELVLNTNSPFELIPTAPVYTGKRLKYGILLIHGLFDCPFSVKDIAIRLEAQGMLCRAVLLPGHGTTPDDLVDINCEEWIQTVRYGISSLKDKVEHIILVGYSTGAALSLHQALNDSSISAIVMLAPLVRIKVPVEPLLDWTNFVSWFKNHHIWLTKQEEKDYAKYLSIAFNAVTEASRLTSMVDSMQLDKKLECPIFMAVSREDQIISSHDAINLFHRNQHPQSQLLIYTPDRQRHADPRIHTRSSYYPELNIKHFSHIALPFSPQNQHYGQRGDYEDASHSARENILYGSFNLIEVNFYDWLRKLRLTKFHRRELTYNPDFDHMASRIVDFIRFL